MIHRLLATVDGRGTRDPQDAQDAARELRDARASAIQFRYLWVTTQRGLEVLDVTRLDQPKLVPGATVSELAKAMGVNPTDVVGVLFRIFGAPIKRLIDKYLGTLTTIFAVLVAAAVASGLRVLVLATRTRLVRQIHDRLDSIGVTASLSGPWAPYSFV